VRVVRSPKGGGGEEIDEVPALPARAARGEGRRKSVRVARSPKGEGEKKSMKCPLSTRGGEAEQLAEDCAPPRKG
jgi:hypothetical protein